MKDLKELIEFAESINDTTKKTALKTQKKWNTYSNKNDKFCMCGFKERIKYINEFKAFVAKEKTTKLTND